MKHEEIRARKNQPKEYGVHLDVLGRALIAQADERIAWHRQMARSMTAELKSAASMPDEAGKRVEFQQQQLRRNDLERKISGHLDYARFLTFVRRSLVRTRRYRLSLSDLRTLEISPRGLYL